MLRTEILDGRKEWMMGGWIDGYSLEYVDRIVGEQIKSIYR